MADFKSTGRSGHGQPPPAGGRKHLTFHLDGDEFGIEVLKVQEITRLLPMTRVSGTQPYMRGVINLRGKTIPVMDLRVRFAMRSAPDTETTCIVVVNLDYHTAGHSEVGLVVDGVTEVIDTDPSTIQPPPDVDGGNHTQYATGMAKLGDRVVLLLDVERLVSSSDLDIAHDT